MKIISIYIHELIVDDEDFDYCCQYKLCVWGGYAHAKIDRKLIKIHKLIALRMGISWDNNIDHKNRNRLDCRRENLRPATSSQNQMNREMPINIAGYKGIYQLPNKRFQAKIMLMSKNINLGCFFLREEAAYAYNVAAKILFKDFALGNN